jgi:quinol monooxygenase YgiN
VIARTGQPPSLGRPKRCRRQRSSKKNAAPWPAYDPVVIFITAKFRVLAEHADQWAEITREFTEATRAEQGNLWFEWSRSIDDPTEYVLVEAFRDAEAGAQHVGSDHFKTSIATLPRYLVETPRIISQMIDEDDWAELSEMKVE